MADDSSRPNGIPTEILFAQHLAANQKKNRDKALRKLRTYLTRRSEEADGGGFTEEEFLKLWKGLHYCLWMQDKPVVQEELCVGIQSLVHCIDHTKVALLFLKTYFMTQCREWSAIDKWRIDKFLILLRGMLHEGFELLKKKDWNDAVVDEFLDFLESYILCDHEHKNCPEGVRYHMAFIYVPELEKVGGNVLGRKQSLRFLRPWVNMLMGNKTMVLRSYVVKMVFVYILSNSPAVTKKAREADSINLRVHYKTMADMLMAAGASEKCLALNREAIYDLVNDFNDVASGKVPDFTMDDDSGEEPLGEEEIESAVERLLKYEREFKEKNDEGKMLARKRKKKKNVSADSDEAYGTDSNDEIVDEPVKKMKKADKEETIKADSRPTKKIYSKALNRLLAAEKEFMENDSDDDKEDEDSGEEDDAEPSDDNDAGPADAVDGDDVDAADVDEDNDSSDEDDIVDDGGLDMDDDSDDLLAHVEGLKSDDESDQEESEDEADEPPPPKPVTKPNVKHTVDKTQNKKTVNDKKAAASKLPDTPKEQTSDEKTSKQQSRSTDFEVSSFPKTDGEKDLSLLLTPQSNGKPSKQTKPQPTKNKQSVPNGSKSLADFTPPNTTKAAAKYFKKAMSKSETKPSKPSTPSVMLGSSEAKQKRRISFGRSQSVKKTEVSLKGRLSYDPSKTPEQGILKVNPILPGTVIQVGKKATLQNTIKNSKFPTRMMTAAYF